MSDIFFLKTGSDTFRNVLIYGKEQESRNKYFITVPKNHLSVLTFKTHFFMFHIIWTTFKFNRNQLGTVSAFVMTSVPWSDQRAHQVIGEKLLSKEFHCRTTDHK